MIIPRGINANNNSHSKIIVPQISNGIYDVHNPVKVDLECYKDIGWSATRTIVWHINWWMTWSQATRLGLIFRVFVFFSLLCILLSIGEYQFCFGYCKLAIPDLREYKFFHQMCYTWISIERKQHNRAFEMKVEKGRPYSASGL